MSIIKDAIKDALPKKRVAEEDNVTKLRRLKKEIDERLAKEEKSNLPPPPKYDSEPQKVVEEDKPEPQPVEDAAESGKEEVTIEQLIVETYGQVMELRRDVNAILGMMMKMR